MKPVPHRLYHGNRSDWRARRAQFPAGSRVALAVAKRIRGRART